MLKVILCVACFYNLQHVIIEIGSGSNDVKKEILKMPKECKPQVNF